MGKYLDKIRQHERGELGPTIETGRAAPAPPVQAGSSIQWHRGDGTVQAGIVDYLHVDDTGTRWAFVTHGSAWCAVNLKFAKGFHHE